MNISKLALPTVLILMSSAGAFAQGANAGTTGGASGIVGGTQAGGTTAPSGSNGNASTPAPAPGQGKNDSGAPTGSGVAGSRSGN